MWNQWWLLNEVSRQDILIGFPSLDGWRYCRGIKVYITPQA
jgi:hypothetical protein